MATRRRLKEPKPRSPTQPAPKEMMGLPKRLSDCIEEQNTTATAVAELANVSVPVVSQAQNGSQFEGIKAANVIRIAKALGVRPAWLLTGEEPKSPLNSAPVVGGEESIKKLARHIVAEMNAQPPRGKMPSNEVLRADDRDD